jgi:hypothetical protein
MTRTDVQTSRNVSLCIAVMIVFTCEVLAGDQVSHSRACVMRELPIEEDLLYQPSGIAAGSSQLLVVDSGNHRIVSLDYNGKLVESFGGAGGRIGEYITPKSVCLQYEDIAYVTDIGNKRLCRLDLDSDKVSVVDEGYYIFDVAATPDYLVYSGKRTHEDSLVVMLDHSGVKRGIGAPINIEHEYDSVYKTINAVKIACSEKYIAVAFPTIAMIRLYTADGAMVAEYFIDSPSVERFRYQVWESMVVVPNPELRDERLAVSDITKQTLIDDLLCLAKPDRFSAPMYIADIGMIGDHVLVLAGDDLLEIDLGGDIVGTYNFVDDAHERIYAFCFTIDQRGSLWIADSNHTHKIYHSESAGWRLTKEEEQ